MFTLLLLYRRAPRPFRFLAWVVLFIVFVLIIARTFQATHAIKERNSHVHTRRNTR
jgi:hypothetical protein